MKHLILILALFAAPVVQATELPKMSRTNEAKMLRKFPLAEGVTQQQVLDRYGPPSNTVKVLDVESWSYGTNTANTKLYIFEFKNGVVTDVIVRYPGSLFNPRSATACATHKWCNTKGK